MCAAPSQRHGHGSVLAPGQPGREVSGPLKIKQRVGESFQLGEGQCLDAGLPLRGEAAAAALQLAQSESGGFRLPTFLTAFLTTFLPALLPAFLSAFLPASLLALLQTEPKDFLVDGAIREVVERDSTHGANLGDGAAEIGRAHV